MINRSAQLLRFIHCELTVLEESSSDFQLISFGFVLLKCWKDFFLIFLGQEVFCSYRIVILFENVCHCSSPPPPLPFLFFGIVLFIRTRRERSAVLRRLEGRFPRQMRNGPSDWHVTARGKIQKYPIRIDDVICLFHLINYSLILF